MKTSLEKLISTINSDVYDSLAFKSLIEDHLTWLIAHPSTTTIPVTANQIEVYDFDWLGLLTALNLPSELFHTIIRMNGGMSLTDVPPYLRSLKVPSGDILRNFISLISSTKKVK